MPALDLTHANRAAVSGMLADDAWSVTCLCAAWCDVCTDFRERFDRLADRHPDKVVLWIDIEDEAEVVGSFDVENFPTLLIQRGDTVAFYGAIEPDAGTAHRLIDALARPGPASSSGTPATSPANQDADAPRNLRRHLAAAIAGT